VTVTRAVANTNVGNINDHVACECDNVTPSTPDPQP
jgi:hypothetical protein